MEISETILLSVAQKLVVCGVVMEKFLRHKRTRMFSGSNEKELPLRDRHQADLNH